MIGFAVVLGAQEKGNAHLNRRIRQDVAQGTLLIAAVVIQQRRRGARAVGLPT